MTISSPRETATAQAFVNIALIKDWGIMPQNITAATHFAQLLEFKILYRMRVDNVPKARWVGTLTSMTPVFMLPISALVFKERLGWQAVLFLS